MYKKSYYNFKNRIDNGDTIHYNTKTGAVIVVNKNSENEVNDVILNPNSNCDSIFFNSLKNNGFIVEQDYDEYKSIKNRYESKFNNENYINIVLLPSEMCNFTCPYCFIYNYSNKVMDDSTYESIKEYIRKKVNIPGKNNQSKKIHLTWFGGEPLLVKEKIFNFMDDIQQELGSICNISSSIITNGYNLNYKVFNNLLKKGVSSIQITFDGHKSAHDQLRCLHNGDGSFDIIINNLREIVSNVKDDDVFLFPIRINFLKSTYKEIYTLIDDLLNIIGNDSRFKIYCRPVYNFETTRDSINDIEDDIFSVEDGLDEQDKFTRYIRYKSGMKEEYRRIDDSLPSPILSWCGEDNLSSIVIGADRSVYMCASLIGDDSVSIGRLDLDGNIEFYKNSNEWRKSIFEFDNFKECKTCKRLPICMGGCKRLHLSENSRICLWKDNDILKAMENYYTDKYIKEAPMY